MTTKTPPDAYKEYNDAEKANAALYELYWIDLLATAGVNFTRINHTNPYNPKYTWYDLEAVCNGYKITMHVSPHRFEGVRLTIKHKTSTPTAQGLHTYFGESWVKIRSLRGLGRIISRLHRDYYR